VILKYYRSNVELVLGHRSLKSRSNQLIHGGNLMTAFSGKVPCGLLFLKAFLDLALAAKVKMRIISLSRSLSKSCVVV
jgi:hypothetical protein